MARPDSLKSFIPAYIAQVVKPSIDATRGTVTLPLTGIGGEEVEGREADGTATDPTEWQGSLLPNEVNDMLSIYFFVRSRIAPSRSGARCGPCRRRRSSLSAKILSGLPFLIGGCRFLFRPSHLEPLYTMAMGKVMLIVAACGIVLGSWGMRRLARVEV